MEIKEGKGGCKLRKSIEDWVDQGYPRVKTTRHRDGLRRVRLKKRTTRRTGSTKRTLERRHNQVT